MTTSAAAMTTSAAALTTFVTTDAEREGDRKRKRQLIRGAQIKQKKEQQCHIQPNGQPSSNSFGEVGGKRLRSNNGGGSFGTKITNITNA